MVYRKMSSPDMIPSRSHEDSAQLTARRVAAAQQRIEAAVSQLQSGDDWRRFLGLQSRLHAYSANNCLLISMAHHEEWEKGSVSTPWPTYVAGFHTWKMLGRSVDKGQHGYPILAPNRYTRRQAVEADDAARVLARGEEPQPGQRVESAHVLRGFRVEHVFAVEQTTGAPLPEPPRATLLRGEAPLGLWENVVAQIGTCGYGVRLVASADELNGANGRTTWDERLVEVRSDMADAARVKTLLHELGHVILHHPDTLAAPFRGRRGPGRAVMEVEAESVAFIVADAHGLFTDDYSFGYVSTWAGTDGVAVMQATASRVAAAARQIIAASDVDHTSGGHVPGAEVLLRQQPGSRRTSELAVPAGPQIGRTPGAV